MFLWMFMNRVLKPLPMFILPLARPKSPLLLMCAHVDDLRGVEERQIDAAQVALGILPPSILVPFQSAIL